MEVDVPFGLILSFIAAVLWTGGMGVLFYKLKKGGMLGDDMSVGLIIVFVLVLGTLLCIFASNTPGCSLPGR